MRNRTIIIGATAAAVALTIGIAGAVTAGQSDDEQPIRGDALDRATAAALAHTGGGTVTDTEVGDEDSLYEVEVTLDSGRQVDVQLDEDFRVVGVEDDDDSGPDDD